MEKAKKKKGFIVFIIIFVIAVLMVISVVFVGKYMDKNLEVLMNEEILNVDLQEVENGTYKGEYKAFLVAAEVEVTVSNHTITDIVILKHDSGKGQDAEIITDSVMEEQSLEVDAVSGATYSSKVILLAIEDALTNE